MPGRLQANLTLASKQAGERYGALAVTLEMPFKVRTGHRPSIVRAVLNLLLSWRHA